MRKDFYLPELKKLQEEFERECGSGSDMIEAFAHWLENKFGFVIDIEYPELYLYVPSPPGKEIPPVFDFGFETDVEVIEFKLKYL